MTDFNTHRCLFKAYDIRGDAFLFDDDFVPALALSFASHYQSHQVKQLAIGYDARMGSYDIAQCFIKIFGQHGIAVDFIGLTTTPILAYASASHQHNGIMITASHSPKNILGVKWLTYGKSPSRSDIQTIFKALPSRFLARQANQFNPCNQFNQANIDINHHLNHYTADILHIFEKFSAKQKANTLVVDCLNGATGVIAPLLFPKIADNVIFLNHQPNGNYPKGNPDPAEPNRLTELCQAVRHHQADLGFAFDGDGDRLALVDNLGRTVAFDWLIFLLVQCAICHRTQDNNKILYDIKCTHALSNLLQKNRIQGIMTQTGSSHLKNQLQQKHQDAIFAGELSGHFIFNDQHFIAHDDGVYAAMRLLAWLICQKRPLSDIVDALPNIIATPDLYLSLSSLGIQDNDITPTQFIDKLQHHLHHIALPEHIAIHTIDGIRLELIQQEHIVGFGLIRASNTSDAITIRFGANHQEAFYAVMQAFMTLFVQNAHDSLDGICRHIVCHIINKAQAHLQAQHNQ